MQEYLAFAKDLAFRAGDIMLQYFQIGVASEKKPDEGNTPVTVADKEVNKLVVDSVEARFPGHAVLGEEQSLDVDGAEFVWVCDPVDGTIPFSAGIPVNVFSLALVDAKDGQTQLAVVFDPYMKRLYHAVRGGGAFLNDEPIHVTKDVYVLKEATIGMSATRSKAVQSAAFKADLITQSFRQFSLVCGIYEAMLVASGQISAAVYVGFGAHDVAGAQLIVREAGGRCTDIFGNEQRYDQEVHGAIMSNGLVHDELIAIAQQHRLPS